ncbi:YfhO family protein [candidate division KSB1 bacterium]|nr:YfhO family protein [candidate division KSB1 bacterium]
MAKKKRKRTPAKSPSTSARSVSSGFSMPELISKYPSVWAAVLIFILLLILFYQAMFSGKMFLGHDTLKATRCYSTFINNALDRGIYPLWNPYIFSGMPSFASLSSVPRINLVDTIINNTLNFLTGNDFTRILMNYVAFGWFLFFFLRKKNISIGAALFGGVVIVFMPQFIAFGVHGHHSKLLTLALIPLILYLIDQLLKRRNVFFFALTALVLGFQLLRMHVQVVYYTYMLIGLYFAFLTLDDYLQNKKVSNVLKSIGLLAGVILVAVALSSVVYLSVYEYSHYSTRGGGGGGGMAYKDATGWSFSPLEMMTFIVPSFVGFGGETYWGQMGMTDYPLYMGILTLFLFGIAFVLKRDKLTWFFGGIALFSLIVSFGRNFPIFYSPMFKLLPFFNKFRVPSMIHILLDISVAIVAVIGLNALIEMKKHAAQADYDRKVKAITTYFYIFGGVSLVIFLYLLFGESGYTELAKQTIASKYYQLFGYQLKSFQIESLQKGLILPALALARQDGFKLIILLAAGGWAVIAFLKNRINQIVLITVLLALTMVDLWWADFRIIKDKYEKNEEVRIQDPEDYFKETSAVTYFRHQQKHEFRIYDIDGGDENWYMHHLIESVDGYNAAKLRIYQDARDALGYHPLMLLMLNARYIVSAKDELPAGYQMYQLLPNYKNQPVKIFECPYAVPRAYFVAKDTVFLAPEGLKQKGKSYEEHRDSILNFIKSGKFNPHFMSILEEQPPFEIQDDERNRVKITDYDIHNIELEADVFAPAHLVLSEIYYPAGWKAYVDGEETKIYKTNYLLRSIFLKPGKHSIRFVFDPQSFSIGLWISSVTAIFLVVCIVILLVKNRDRRGMRQK